MLPTWVRRERIRAFSMRMHIFPSLNCFHTFWKRPLIGGSRLRFHRGVCGMMSEIGPASM
eukprot:6573533-Pyramimonas_sp.AAC.1